MHLRSFALPAVLAASALVPERLPWERVRFAPEAGATVTKTFETHVELEFEEFSQTVDGQRPQVEPTIEAQSVETTRVVVQDRYVATAEGRPVTLRRTYEEIAHEVESPTRVELMGQEMEVDLHGTGKSALEDEVVEFRWDAESGEYARAFAEEEGGDAELLPGLAEDMDLRALIPPEEVAVGDRWEVDADAVTGFLFPGGDLAIDIVSDGEDAPPGMAGPGEDPPTRALLCQGFEEEGLEGEVSCRLAAVREEEGTRVAVIEVELDLDSTADVTELYREALEANQQEGMELELDRVSLTVTLEGQGELLWDLGAGRMHAFEASCELGLDYEQVMQVEAGGRSLEIVQNAVLSGTLAAEASVE